MAQRSFSLLLARRYLNPRRAMLSSFTLISLVGVLLGVLVLVVVMAVYAGMERDVKGRLLGFTPHVLMRFHPEGGRVGPVTEWREPASRMSGMPGVRSATPFVADNVIVDIESFQRPVLFYGVQTEDAAQVEGITRMLDTDHYPESSADMGLDDRVVVSSTLADQLGLRIGEVIRLYSTRNFDQVMQAYKSTEKPPVREAFRESWVRVNDLLKGWKADGDRLSLPAAVLDECGERLDVIQQQRIREPERELIGNILQALQGGESDEKAGVHRFIPEVRQDIDGWISELSSTDAGKMDGEILKGLKSVVLPKEATVIGVYQSSQMNLNTPDIFMPLGLAQTLAGLDDGVQGITLRLEDPYKADEVARAVRSEIGRDWDSLTWMEQYASFFALISQQRVMMYFALSFIVLVSAFSMMAVMFTVTIQKKREIGVMKALGAAPNQIVRVFLYQGMILGVLGAIAGLGLGRLVIHYRGALQAVLRGLGFDPFSAQFTGFTVLPAYNDPREQVVIAFLAFVLCSLAALVPAAFAARSDAAKSLRNL